MQNLENYPCDKALSWCYSAVGAEALKINCRKSCRVCQQKLPEGECGDTTWTDGCHTVCGDVQVTESNWHQLRDVITVAGHLSVVMASPTNISTLEKLHSVGMDKYGRSVHLEGNKNLTSIDGLRAHGIGTSAPRFHSHRNMSSASQS